MLEVSLIGYRNKRDFEKTSEPEGSIEEKKRGGIEIPIMDQTPDPILRQSK